MRERDSRPVAVVARVTAATRVLAAHEEASLDAMAAQIATLRGARYLGRIAGSEPCDGVRPYFVPDDTLEAAQARLLGVQGPDDLFGGVVPYRFAATKVISHPLVPGAAVVPAGWVAGLEVPLDGAVLPGFAVFSREDARRAGATLLPLGRLRLKLARGIGGVGQVLVRDACELDAALDDLPGDELRTHGATLEQDLAEAETWSIGYATCAGIEMAYVGVQRQARNRNGHAVYGGSDLDVIRGDFATLAQAPMPAGARDAVRRAQAYDTAMLAAFPGTFASRRNYDVVAGRDREGRDTAGVLEQSWRIGGASPAELLALRVFAKDPSRRRLRASCHEVHGDHQPPAGATINYRGDDPQLGALSKYAVLG